MPFQEKPPRLPPGYKVGKFRVFHSTVLSPPKVNGTLLSKFDHFLIVFLLSLAFIIRLYNLPYPPRVVFDEVHFGSFARDYFRGEFFVDVHPPLVKLVFYWIALTLKWDGKFPFEQIGDLYDTEVPYVAMRLFSALCGIGTVVLTFLILRLSNCRSLVALIGALLVLIENSLVIQSRAILLDCPLIFFMTIAIYGYKKQRMIEPLSTKWFKALLLCGIGLGLTVSSKLTGLFTIAWVGVLTIIELWNYIGDLHVTVQQLYLHFAARVVALIIVPLTIYLSVFQIHFISLPYNGSGSGAMSPNFKSSLIDSDELRNMPVEVSYGSTVTIKHNNLESYLHSHDHNYPGGSKEQQVSLYGFSPDENNEWIIETKNKNREGQLQSRFRPVKDGDIIRLYHNTTGKYLHVNDIRPPISEHDYSNEVSCHGDRELLGDINYEFKVRIMNKKSHATNNLPMIKLRATESIFQLIHQGTKCVMLSHAEKLPNWGFGQNEVLCVNEPTIPNTFWYIETNSHPLLNNDTENYARVKFPPYTFLEKIWEYHKAMVRINKSFTDDHVYSSKAETWPFVLRGINYFSNEISDKLTDEEGSHIYLLGNLAIYYVAFFLLMWGIAKLFFVLIKNMNPFIIPYEPLATSIYIQNSFEIILGWALHYFPSFYMKRQLFLHHYLPALFFSILLIAQFIEYQVSRRRLFGYFIMASVVLSAVYCYITFIPIIYGTDWTRAACNNAKWFRGWDFDCMTYTH
ncbi:dolichyl-phosphate-mannose-protein mannosyltransferase [Scheffersomyces xylosifermentans]|uniref:dolichyl-phosphate-mannose-protein mannosyltransferase n=1 Tax=Scheffersomyces xylosifermentans TaxID=1304137 RepID=UPI00315D1ECA